MDLPLPMPEKPAVAPKKEGENSGDNAKPSGKKKVATYRKGAKAQSSTAPVQEVNSGEFGDVDRKPPEAPAATSPTEEPAPEKAVKPVKKSKAKPKK